MDSAFASIVAIVAVAGLLVVTGLRRQPGLGAVAAVVVVAMVLAMRGDGLASLGLGALDASWWRTLLLALGLGVAIQLLSVLVVEPWSERWTGVPHDHGIVDGVRGSARAFGLWMLVVWLVIAPIEEVLFRGFLMTEIARLVGTGFWASVLNVAATSIVFGLAHAYQGRSGVLSTGVAGAALGVAFVASGFDLWLVILAHGFVDTVGLALVATGADRAWRGRRADDAG